MRETELRIVWNRETKKITKYYALGLFAVREGGFEVPSRYAKNLKYLRILNYFAVREAFL